MSHKIIIRSEAETPGAVAVEVTFTPPHTMSEGDVLKKVGKLLKQVKQMQSAPAPGETV